MSDSLGQIIQPAVFGDVANLGLLATLPGKWVGQGRGWNMIALPVDKAHSGGKRFEFRLLLNQFDETLEFTNELTGVPNRGFPDDQHLNGLQYIQDISQLIAVDSLGSQISPVGPAGIHHETGLFLRLLDQLDKDSSGKPMDIARLGSVPHGDVLAALGNGLTIAPATGIDLAASAIGDFSGLPIGAGPRDLNNPYLAPYKKFHDQPFKGVVNVPGFPGFDPTNPLALLQSSPPTPFKSMTVIVLDTINHGGITNLPFIVHNANATEMRFVIWIEELQDSTPAAPKFQLQYAQRVLLEFFPSFGNPFAKIKWPHISINTLELDPKAT